MTIFSYTPDELPAFLEALQRENERLLAVCARLHEQYEAAIRNQANETIFRLKMKPHAFQPQSTPDDDLCEVCEELIGGPWHEIHRLEAVCAQLQEENGNLKEQIASTLQNPAADGCSGVGRPSCKAAECLFGLDKTLEPKRWSCAFTDEVIPELHEGLCQLSDAAKVTIDNAEAQVTTLTAALRSIANNSCCTTCREAALVAQTALNKCAVLRAASEGAP